jgi:hypothetical protein
MFSIFSSPYFTEQKNGITQFQLLQAYLLGSTFQTVCDNPVTAYRQLVQQYSTDLSGKIVSPKIASIEAKKTFRTNPIGASLSGLGPRLIGVGFKRIPKFTALLGISYILGEGEDVGLAAATGASIISAYAINPIRMIEKQQRAFFRETGAEKPIKEILREASIKNYKPLFRGTVPLMGHSLASATTGLVGQPKLQKYIQNELGNNTSLGTFGTGLISSSIVSPIYVFMTNPLSRLEVIMQTKSIDGKGVSVMEAMKEVVKDSKEFGLRGVFRGQGIGITKAIISLTLFHQGRIEATNMYKKWNADDAE